MNNTIELLTANEVAEFLKVSLSTIRAWCSEGSIPHYKIGLRCVRFDRNEVINWITKIRKGNSSTSDSSEQTIKAHN